MHLNEILILITESHNIRVLLLTADRWKLKAAITRVLA